VPDSLDFTLAPRDITFVGEGLARPECVLATARGALFVSDRRGGVTRIDPDGRQALIGGGADVVSNGIALRPDGSLLLANLHGAGGVWALSPDGRLTPWLTEVDGVCLPSVNFVRLDEAGRVWVCVNPPLGPDGRYRTEAPDGFVALIDERGARIVADGIATANECWPAGPHLFLNETFGRCLTRFDVAADGALSNRTAVTRFGHGTYPDGLGRDAEGHFWIVSVASNRLVRVAPDGSSRTVFEDCDPGHLDALEADFQAHRLTRAALTKPTGRLVGNLTSIAFGGPDRRTAYLGSIVSPRLASFRSPVPGARPVHWDW
jgi:sugar lactone lactonase YvrE